MSDVISDKQKIIIALAHLSYFIGGIGFIIVPLVIMIVCRDDEFVHYHARQAFVCHIVVLIMAVAIVGLILLGRLAGVDLITALTYLIAGVLVLLEIVLLVVPIIATVKGCRGEYYEYPITGNFA